MKQQDVLRVQFQGPENGWLVTELTQGNAQCAIASEHVPHDTIQQLAKGLGDLLAYGNAFIAKATDGPIKYEYSFCLTDESLTVVINEMKANVVFSEIFRTSGPAYYVARSFWKALRELETRFAPEEYQARWREPFPHAEMSWLSKQIERQKSSHTKNQDL